MSKHTKMPKGEIKKLLEYMQSQVDRAKFKSKNEKK